MIAAFVIFAITVIGIVGGCLGYFRGYDQGFEDAYTITEEELQKLIEEVN